MSLLIYSLVPVVAIIVFIYNKDNNKEPLPTILKLIIGGVLSAVLTLIINFILELLLGENTFTYSNKSGLYILFYAMIVISLVEELSKFIFVYFLGYKDKNYDEEYDILLYGALVGLGFAGIENILYVMDGGKIIAIVRALTAVPLHASLGIVMGYFLNKLKVTKKKVNLVLALLVPVIIHGLYDWFCFYQDDNSLSNIFQLYCLLGCIIFCIGFIIFENHILNKYNKLSEKREKSSNNEIIDQYCPICGAKYISNYCGNCGNKRERRNIL